MKKYFNKSIFKDKSFIKMICFTIVLLLVLILGNTFGYVSAEESSGEYCLNYQDYVSSASYNSNIVTNSWFFGNRDNFSKTLYENISSLDASSINGSSYKYYAICYGNNYGDELSIYFFTDTPYYISRDDARYIYTRGDVVRYPIVFTTNGIEWWDFAIGNVPHTVTPVENGTLKAYNFGGIPVAYSNFELFAPLNGWESLGYPDSFTAFVRSYIENDDSSYFTNYNYILSDNGGVMGINGLDNLVNIIDGSSDNSEPNASNYMFADYADWYLTNFNGDIQNRYRTVSTCFTSNLNDYINSNIELNNPNADSAYTIDFDFSCYVDFYYSTVSEASDSSIDIGNNFISGSISGGSSILNKTYFWSASYEAPDSIGNYLSGMHIDASTFADNNYIQEFPLSSLFAYMEPTNSYVVNSNGEKNSITLSLQELMYLLANGLIENSDNEVIELQNFKLTCTATIQYGDAYDDVFHSQYDSGIYSETFDLLTGQSTLNSDAMLTNYNPYIENTDTDYSSNLPSTDIGSNSNSTSVTTGNVTQTVTVTNSGAQYIPSLISNLIPTSLGDTGTGLVSTFSTMAQTNGFISVMASTVPAIPSTVWTYLTNYLGISLYLLACAFVLRLILDLL